MKYRILETINDGESKFYPQRKILWIWFTFKTDYGLYVNIESFNKKIDAEKFMSHNINPPKINYNKLIHEFKVK